MRQNTDIRSKYPDYPESFAGYLEVNGYTKHTSNDLLTVSFTNWPKVVMFQRDAAYFFEIHDGDDDRATEKSQYGMVDGLCQMDDFKFMLQMHIFDIVPMKDFVRRVKKESDVHPIFQPMLETFFNHHTPAEHPVNY